jgi:hypothetical protein
MKHRYIVVPFRNRNSVNISVAMRVFSLFLNLVAATVDIRNGGALVVDDDGFAFWEPTDVVDVYVGEYRLENFTVASWFNVPASHIGLVFHNTMKDKYVIYDYFIRGDAGFPCLLIPAIIPGSGFDELSFLEALVMYMKGDLIKYLEWTSDAIIHLRDDPPHDFKHMDYMGRVDGESVREIRRWIVDEYTAQIPFTYDIWSLYERDSRIRSSKTCFDFVETCLDRLFGRGGNRDSEDSSIVYYREGFLVNTTNFEPIIDMESSRKNRRDFQRFLRFFKNHVYEASARLEYARILASKISYFNIPLVLPLERNRDYARFQLADHSIVNYCRYPVDIIPGKGSFPAKLDDTRTVCFLKKADLDQVLMENEMKLTFTDYSIWIEKIIDDFISDDSSILAVVSTLVLVGIARLGQKGFN